MASRDTVKADAAAGDSAGEQSHGGGGHAVSGSGEGGTLQKGQSPEPRAIRPLLLWGQEHRPGGGGRAERELVRRLAAALV